MAAVPKVLTVGLCCLDIVNEVDEYPKEDTDQRCISQTRQRGGNASNSSTVLSALGAECQYCGTIAETSEKTFLLDDFDRHCIGTEYCQLIPDSQCPTSCVVISRKTGSRTIFHCNKNLPELSYKHLTGLDLKPFDWVHFEGRNIDNIRKSIPAIREDLRRRESKTVISIEVEKVKDEMEGMAAFADLVFVSREFAESKGALDMKEAASIMAKAALPGAIVVCPWGAMGAAAHHPSRVIVTSKSFPPLAVVDSVGAGDTFIGAFIYAAVKLLKNHDSSHKQSSPPKMAQTINDKVSLISDRLSADMLQQAIVYACEVAGAKVGVKGWDAFRAICSTRDTFIIES